MLALYLLSSYFSLLCKMIQVLYPNGKAYATIKWNDQASKLKLKTCVVLEIGQSTIKYKIYIDKLKLIRYLIFSQSNPRKWNESEQKTKQSRLEKINYFYHQKHGSNALKTNHSQ